MDSQVASLISAYIPELSMTLPVVGTVNFTPYVAAVAIFVVLTTVFWLIRIVVIARLRAVSKRTSTDFDDMVIDAVGSIRFWVYTYIAFYISLQPFAIPDKIMMALKAVLLFAVVWQLIEIAVTIIDYLASRFLEKDEDGDGEIDPGSATASHMVALIARIVLWALGLLFVLSNLGIEVTSLLAGLGIGGIAIAFALQGILSDLFASFSLYFDKPFRIGDYIVIGEHSGTVERIGVKTTRIRTLQGEELVVSNAELTSARVQNFKKMEERRISSQFGVTYETDQKLLKEIPGIVTRIFEDLDGARLDRVFFTTFGDFALIYDVVYYIESAEYADFLKHQQQFNFMLLERFTELGIDFAYPTNVQYTKEIV